MINRRRFTKALAAVVALPSMARAGGKRPEVVTESEREFPQWERGESVEAIDSRAYRTAVVSNHEGKAVTLWINGEAVECTGAIEVEIRNEVHFPDPETSWRNLFTAPTPRSEVIGE